MADVVLFRDTFDGPAGPVDEGRAPDVGAYEFLSGELDGLGTLTSDNLRGGGSATPNPAATYRAAIELLTTGGLGGVELGAGGDTYFWATVRFVDGVGLVVSPGTQDDSFDDVPVSMPEDAVPLSIEVGPSGTDVSYMGDVVATIPTFTSASFSGAGIYVGAYSAGGGAVVLNYVELTQSAPTDGGGGSPPPAPVNAALPAGLDTSWEAAQEEAPPGVGWSVFEDFAAGVEAPTDSAPVASQVGTSGATWSSEVENWEY